MAHCCRVIVQQLHGHWSVWWEHEPQMASGDGTSAEAVDRLVGFVSGGDGQGYNG